jgi:hypothetical protein
LHTGGCEKRISFKNHQVFKATCLATRSGRSVTHHHHHHHHHHHASRRPMQYAVQPERAEMHDRAVNEACDLLLVTRVEPVDLVLHILPPPALLWLNLHLRWRRRSTRDVGPRRYLHARLRPVLAQHYPLTTRLPRFAVRELQVSGLGRKPTVHDELMHGSCGSHRVSCCT